MALLEMGFDFFCSLQLSSRIGAILFQDEDHIQPYIVSHLSWHYCR
jgi:hypothetical protein